MALNREERWLDVGAVDEFIDKKFRKFPVGPQEVGVVRVEGKYFAIVNVCPHAFGPLCHGAIEQKLIGDVVGQPKIEADRPVVACPWHGWEFDLNDGKCVTDPSWKVRTFKVEERDGRVFLSY